LTFDLLFKVGSWQKAVGKNCKKRLAKGSWQGDALLNKSQMEQE
jgi:hypothetical protein